MGCKIKRIYLCLLIMSIYLCGCHTEENKDKLCLEKEKHSIENTEEIFETNEAISEMEEIIEACIYEHSFTKYENGEWIIYECEPVEGSLYESYGTSTIRLRRNFNAESYSYEEAKEAIGKLLDFRIMRHFYNPENEYGITDVYEAVAGSTETTYKTCYLIYRGSNSYLIYIDGRIRLSLSMFPNISYYDDFSEEYQKQVIKCGNNRKSTIISDIYNEDNIAVYELYYDEQKKPDFMMELQKENNSYTLKIIQNQKEIQKIEWESEGINVYPQFLDANGDGYTDMLLVTKQGIANNEKDLYVWDNQSNYYSKVIYKGDNFLADIEVKENGIWNWLDNGVTGYTLEVLEWSGNALIPVYTEIYEPEESNE